MNYEHKVWQILFDLESALVLIRNGVPCEDISLHKGYVVENFHDVEFWAFRLPKEDGEAARELLAEVRHEYAIVWKDVLSNAEIKFYSK